MNIVKEVCNALSSSSLRQCINKLSQMQEMNLLVEADQPGNQLDDYVSRLNAILSQKAAGILQLQTRLAQFQKRLKEHNVLVSSSGY